MRQTKPYKLYIFLSAILLVLFFADLMFGSVSIPLSKLLNFLLSGNLDTHTKTIILQFRLPRVSAAIGAGIALSISGLIMQTVFRNPLAGPYVLGISSGAGLGVALIIIGFQVFGISVGLISNFTIAIAALLGSGLLLFILLTLSFHVRDIMTILIIGILFSSSVSAIISVLQYLSPESALKNYVMWTMGNLGNVNGSQLQVMWLMIIVGTAIAYLGGKGLNIMLLGEQYTKSTGQNVLRIRIVIFIATSLLAGGITAFCGPIGFIGIAVPHVVRLLFRTTNHFILIPGTMLLGASIMLLSDLISHLPGLDFILPINSITAIMGIPMVIWIILRNRKYSRFF